jgi:hypothetical protein
VVVFIKARRWAKVIEPCRRYDVLRNVKANERNVSMKVYRIV